MNSLSRTPLISEEDVYANTPLRREDIEEAIRDGELTVFGTSDGLRLFSVEEVRALVNELYEEDDDPVSEVDNPSGFNDDDFEV